MLEDRTKPLFILAPMDDVTDTVFRQIIHDCAPADLYFTEFVNVDGLISPGRPKLLKKLVFTQSEGPLIAQLWGLNPENFETIAHQISDGTIAREIYDMQVGSRSTHGDEAQGDSEARNEPYLGYGEVSTGAGNAAVRSKASSTASLAGRQAEPMRNFVGIDLNMGCPAKSEVKNGACSALIKNRPLAKEIIEATKRGAGDMPVSVKTRIGFSEIDLTWVEFLLGFDLDMLTLHWRTRKEMSKVPAHWDLASDVISLRDKISPTTKIVGNGDVMSRAEGEQLATKYGLDGIMIGRGVFHDPYVFAHDDTWSTVGMQERIDLYRRHVELFRDTWQVGDRPIHTLNKFCKIYVSGFDGAKELREKLMAAESTDELLSLMQDAVE